MLRRALWRRLRSKYSVIILESSLVGTSFSSIRTYSKAVLS